MGQHDEGPSIVEPSTNTKKVSVRTSNEGLSRVNRVCLFHFSNRKAGFQWYPCGCIVYKDLCPVGESCITKGLRYSGRYI